MGEYIKNKKVDNSEIKIGLFSGDKKDLFFPVDMLKEFLFLGYEEYYAGKYNGKELLEKSIEDLEKNIIPHTFFQDREFLELNFKRKISEKKLNDIILDFDLLILHRDNNPIYLLNKYYQEEFEQYCIGVTKGSKIPIELIPYKYQYIENENIS